VGVGALMVAQVVRKATEATDWVAADRQAEAAAGWGAEAEGAWDTQEAEATVG